jgi:hypothetical protein
VPNGYIFVSHSRRNAAEVQRLVSWLHAAGLATWTSGPRLHCPAWQDEIFPYIAGCAVFAVLASPEAAAADGVAQEIAYAKRLGKPIVTVPLRTLKRSRAGLWRPGPTGAPRFAAPGTRA